jgi:putative spermidine/putrescine transport system ATP-binding protein
LEFRKLTKAYGAGDAAVREVDLSVRTGEFLTLLGPSGSGKTTILKLVAGFIAPSAGEIFINGVNMSGLPPRERQIGMVLQNYALFPHMTVLENIEYGLKLRRWKKPNRAAKVAEMLQIVGLSGFEARLPRELSGGQQQRVALARALAFDPALLLMDEPLGALDRELRRRMTVELRRIHSQLGTTFVYVTHDRDEALSMSDRVALMHNGVIEGVGTPHSLFTQPSSRFVASFFGSHNILPATVVSGSTVEPLPGQGRPTKVRCLGQVIEVNSWTELTSGGDVLVAVPTEALRTTESAETSLLVEGHVDQLIYLGQYQELFFKTEAGDDMTARLALNEQCPQERGAPVRLHAEASRLVAVPVD